MNVHVLSLGCARALVDSEGMAGLLQAAGHTLTDRLDGADCVVVNTCAFIQAAEEESIATLLELADRKRTGRLRQLFVAGCLPQKRRGEREDLLNLLPEVDGFVGTGDLDQLPELIRGQTAAGRFFVASPVPTLLFESRTPRVRLGPPHSAYLKISEGCDHACTFCSIPQFRGPHRSRSIEDLILEAQRLAEQGVVELNLIGQDTSAYGLDRYGALRLPQLLTGLNEIPGIRWIRLLYAHPAHVTDPLITAMRELPKVVKYLDLPIQHISDEILSAMRRETDGTRIRNLIERLRRDVAGIVLRATLMVGFPGETEPQFQELCEFLRTFRLERVGVFTYAPEPKTRAARMPNRVPEAIKKKRFNQLMQLQQGISETLNRRWLGQTLEVLVDEPTESSSSTHLLASSFQHLYLGRTYADAPEVDGQVFLRSERPFQPGQFVEARVVDTHEYDLVAEA